MTIPPKVLNPIEHFEGKGAESAAGGGNIQAYTVSTITLFTAFPENGGCTRR